jgi:ABC-type polysaccharide/polyol phosphate export permease
MVMAAGAASGLGLMLSAIHVFFRDAAQAIQILLQVGFWFNPIVYTKGLLAASIGEGAATWLSLNPVEHFVSLAQSAIGASTAAPAPSAVAVVLLFPAVCIGVGRIVFIRLLPEARDGL